MKRNKIIICGGGTAGHLYPALAVGQKLIEKKPELKILFVGGSRKLEKKIMDHHQVNFIALQIEGLKGRGLKILRSLFILPYAFFKSFLILIRNKPGLVIGVGGYSSGPLVLLAAWMILPTIILEQNRYPGFTNRMLLPWVKKAVVAFQSSLDEFKGKGVYLGNPVREEFYHVPPKTRESQLSLLIFGGSQGSHFLNTQIVNSLPEMKALSDHLVIYHQTGEKDHAWIQNAYAKHGFKNVTVAPFFFKMPEYFQKSDLIISRAGASTIAELIAAQKAALLVPFAEATDDHQVLNAMELVRIGAAEVLLEKDFNPATFTAKVLEYIHDKEKITKMENNLIQLQTENVADKIADLCLELMERRG